MSVDKEFKKAIRAKYRSNNNAFSAYPILIEQDTGNGYENGRYTVKEIKWLRKHLKKLITSSCRD